MELKIRTTADASGAEQVEKALDEVKQAVQEAAAGPTGQPFAPLVKGAEDAAQAVKNVADAGKEITVAPSGEGFGPLIDQADQAVAHIEKVTTAMEGAGDAATVLDPVEEALKKIDAAGAEVQSRLDGLNQDLEEIDQQQRKATISGDEQAKSLKKIETAGRAVVALQLASFLGESITKLRDATSEGGEFEGKLGDIKGALDQAENALGVFQAGLGTFIATGNPILGALGGIGGGLGGLTRAWQDMRAAQRSVSEGQREYIELQESMRQGQQRLAEEARSEFQLKVYREEADELERAGRALERNNELRNAQNDAAVAEARANVTVARNTGGDVALAEARLLATQLTSQLQALDANLAESQQKAAAAAQEAERARVAANDAAVNNPAKFEELDQAADEAAKRAADAMAESGHNADMYRSEKQKILADTRGSLSGLTSEVNTATSAAAKSELSKIQSALNSGYSTLSQAVPKISGEAAKPVLEQIKQVDQAVKTERTNTTNAIVELTPKPQDTKAVESAVRGLERGMEERDNKIIAVVTALTAYVQSRDGQISGLQQQINSLRGQIR